MADELLTEEIRGIARSMITCSHYNNLPDWKLDVYLKEILAHVQPIIEKQERERIMKIFASFGKIQLKKPLSGKEFEALFD